MQTCNLLKSSYLSFLGFRRYQTKTFKIYIEETLAVASPSVHILISWIRKVQSRQWPSQKPHMGIRHRPCSLHFFLHTAIHRTFALIWSLSAVRVINKVSVEMLAVLSSRPLQYTYAFPLIRHHLTHASCCQYKRTWIAILITPFVLRSRGS